MPVSRGRDAAVQEFFATLTGCEPSSIGVFGEEIETIQVPSEARYPALPVDPGPVHIADPDRVHAALCALAGVSSTTPREEAARRCRLLRDLNRWLTGAPMSMSQIVARLRQEVAERHQAEEDALCRNCGADYLRFVGNPEAGPLRTSAVVSEKPEHMLYVPERFELPEAEDEFDDEDDPELPLGTRQERRRGGRQTPEQIKRMPVLHGSVDPATLTFSADETDYSLKVTFAPARTKCLCCGGTAGSRNVVPPVSLGTSAALKVMTEGLFEALDEANRDRPDHDAKEHLLIFSDSRQDAAHQARFILFASRYDHMRRAVVRLLDQHGDLPIQRVVELLGGSVSKVEMATFTPSVQRHSG